MTEHVTQWLSAYQDGELQGRQRQQVETHLAGCEECRGELQALHDLSALLYGVPVPEFTPSERLAAQVNLRLPRIHAKAPEHKVWEVGWWMIPAGLLSLWILMTAVGWLGDVVTAANRWGLLDTTSAGTIQVGPVQIETLPAWLTPDSASAWSGVLSRLGFLHGSGLVWAATIESFLRNTLPLFVGQVSIAVLYLGWLTIGWARYTRQEHGQLRDVAALSSK